MAKEIQIVCKNVFKSGNQETFKTGFTKRWVELINQLEKNKGSKPVENDLQAMSHNV